MEIKRAAELLRGLADGRDPITGARLPDESVYNHPEIIRALHCVLQELLQNAQQAAARYHSPVTRFVRNLQSRGSVTAVRDFVRRRAPSDVFASLEQAGHLELSPEATVIQARYGPLFTDEEINTCLTLLLEAGYF